ncbi:fatty acyl-CoA reductase wat-like isoform X2 [Sitophilus oryzae]|uniref:Fatty acyl-CoA reductase n=1 Tax=Sitophilus oryzae TaxID=7048 RepID=A0A6J2X890_SITOR|nr:fatty acyl-CoA reductase wat-like isoform X2 [Sitophilus oryzae]
MEVEEREGQDITASDMIVPEEDSDIKAFFAHSSVFITGVTGFLGKLAMEKLLWTCNDVNKIFVLIRNKKDKSPEDRLEELLNEPIFERLNRTSPDYKEKIHVINGDISLPGLGLDLADEAMLIAEVDCIMHFAATVKFDETLKSATYINVRAVRDLIEMAKQMKKLKAFLNVSTAFSNCNRKEIDEVLYEAPITGEKLLTLVECLDEDQLNDITKTIIKDFPNTYVFTKCVAEDLIKTEGQSLPIALFRPSIVIATVREPVSGYIDNIYGATGALVCAAIGVLRSLHCKKDYKAELVPADYVINGCLAAMWDVATIRTLNDNNELHNKESRESKFHSDVPVYNYVSSPENPLTWNEVQSLTIKHSREVPSEKIVWHYMFKMRSNYVEHNIAVFFLHTLPAYIIDFVLMCLRRRTSVVKSYKKINKFANVLTHFTMNEWKFRNENVKSLWKRMKKNDKEHFDFNIATLNWDFYFHTYIRDISSILYYRFRTTHLDPYQV